MNGLGGFLALLDAGRNRQASNQTQLFREIATVDDSNSAMTLGGAFSASHKGYGDVIGDALERHCRKAPARLRCFMKPTPMRRSCKEVRRSETYDCHARIPLALSRWRM